MRRAKHPKAKPKPSPWKPRRAVAEALPADLEGPLRSRLLRVLDHLDRTLADAGGAILARDPYAKRAGEAPPRPRPPGDNEPVVEIPGVTLQDGTPLRLRADEARWLDREQREARELLGRACPAGLRGRKNLETGGEYWAPLGVPTDSWPLELPTTVAAALSFCRERADQIVREVVDEIAAVAGAIIPDERLRRAVLARDVVARFWSIGESTLGTSRMPFAFLAMAAADDAWPEDEPRPRHGAEWIHPDAAPSEVARWAHDGLNAATDRQWAHPWTRPDVRLKGDESRWGDVLMTEVEERGAGGFARCYFIRREEGGVFRMFAPGALALLHVAERAVLQDQRAPMMVVDASYTHHSLIHGMRDFNGQQMMQRREESGHPWKLEILPPGGSVQMELPLEGESPHEAIVRALSAMKGALGLRVYAAMLRLFSIEGARTGRLRWTRASLLDAMGVAERRRREDGGMVEAARDITTFLTSARLVVYAQGGDREGAIRESAPIFSLIRERERMHDGEWIPEGAELQLNPLLSGGHRQAGGQIGGDFSWAPAELATLNHHEYNGVPHAFPLGLILPIRWRWDAKQGRTLHGLTGRAWLRTAGIEWRDHPSEIAGAFKKLDRALEALVRVGLVGEIIGHPWALDAVVTATPAPALADRLRGLLPELPPDELPTDDTPKTGAELRAWRKVRGWTQEGLAARVGVTSRTIIRNEQAAGDELPARLRGKLQGVGDAPKT